MIRCTFDPRFIDDAPEIPLQVEVLKTIDCVIFPNVNISDVIDVETAVAGPNSTVSIRLLPVEIVQPKVNEDGTAGELGRVDSVRFSRWFNAYPAAAPFTQKPNWVDNDADRFVIRVPTAFAADKVTTKIKLKTKAPQGLTNGTTYEDNATEVTLTKDASGQWFESKPMVLVTNQEDADEAKNGIGGANNALDDRTHIGWMDGKIEIELTDANNQKIEFPISKKKGTVKVQLAVVDAQGAYSRAGVLGELDTIKRETKEIWAQHLVDVSFVGNADAVPFTATNKIGLAVLPNAEDSRDRNIFLFKPRPFDSNKTLALSHEAEAALDEVATQIQWQQDAIRVLFAPFDTASRVGVFGGGGVFEMGAYTLLGENIDYMGHDGTIIMNSHIDNAQRHRMLAHEVGHVLLPSVNHSQPEPPNDFVVPGNPAYPWHLLMFKLHSGEPEHSKRLAPTEEKPLYNQRSPYLKQP